MNQINEIIEKVLEHEKRYRKPYIRFFFDTRLEVILFLISIIAFAVSLALSLWNRAPSAVTGAFLAVFFLSTLVLYISSMVINIRYVLFLFSNYLKGLHEVIEKDEKLVAELATFKSSVLEAFERRIQFEKGQIQSRVTSLAGDKVGVLAAVTAVIPIVTQQLEISSLPALLVGALYFAAVMAQSLLRRLEKLEFLLKLAKEQVISTHNQGDL